MEQWANFLDRKMSPLPVYRESHPFWRFDPRDAASAGSRVSVVMITRNRGAQIVQALEHLLDLPEQPPVIVVDNGSSDATVSYLLGMGSGWSC